MHELRDRAAVITGGGSGIGAAIARRCAAAGMQVLVADIEPDAAHEVANALCFEGATAHATYVDVADRSSVLALAESAWRLFGGCHLLCNNAGVSVFRPLAQSSRDDWNWVLSVNLMGVVHGVEAFVPRMIEQARPAHIVNVASMAGLIPLPGFGVYAASKHAVVGLSEVLQMELEPHGIGVSIVCPGMVSTRIQDSERNRPGVDGAVAGSPAAAPDFPTELAQLLEPDDVAAHVVAAVQKNQLYVLTHTGWESSFARRSRNVFDAFSNLRESAAGKIDRI